MTLHKSKLVVLRNRNNIVVATMTTIALTLLFLEVIVLVQVLHQAQKDEQLLKGLSCISLIPPDKRTVQDIKACIQTNRPPSHPFNFSPSPDSNKSSSSKPSKPVESSIKPPANVPAPPLAVAPPVKLAPLKTKTSATAPPLPKPAPQVIQETCQIVETRTNPITGNLEWRYEGTDLWFVVNTKVPTC